MRLQLFKPALLVHPKEVQIAQFVITNDQTVHIAFLQRKWTLMLNTAFLFTIFASTMALLP